MKCSVGIPYYNVRGYVEVCLQSVIRASKAVSGQIEIIVVNDASTDGTRQKVEQIARDLAHDIPMVNINNPENRGLAAARNVALSYPAGPMCCCLMGIILFTTGSLRFSNGRPSLIQMWISSFLAWP